jgi:hypothetical protein
LTLIVLFVAKAHWFDNTCHLIRMFVSIILVLLLQISIVLLNSATFLLVVLIFTFVLYLDLNNSFVFILFGGGFFLLEERQDGVTKLLEMFDEVELHLVFLL